ncbi:hypothetical protein [Nocardia barduliensis]|uniref:hypothetical protein n=1 Tax=Nocardia barduliensis TaxID=2736643 RepID=UPI0015735191|nr:hypothetical protein [Nocardia barduliensis]
MVERRILRAAGLARLLGVLALLAGVIAMHSAIFAGGGHGHAAGAHPASASAAVPGGPGPGSAALVSPGPAHETGSHHRDAAPPTPDSASGHDRHHPQERTFLASFRTAEAPIVASDESFAAQVVAAPTGPASWTETARSIENPPCAGGGCEGTHSALHGCVFILVALVALAALVLLYRMAVDRPGNGVARPRHWRPRQERPPPWTVLTRAELAILRI